MPEKLLAVAEAALTPPPQVPSPLPNRGSTWSELDHFITPVHWDWPGWLPHDFLTVLACEPGVGKSFLALRIAAAYIDGRPWPDGAQFTAARGKTLWAETESGQRMHRQRLRAMELDPDQLVWLLHAPDPADPGHLCLSMVKNNLAPLAGPIGVRIDSRGPHFGPPPQACPEELEGPPSPPAASQSEEDRAAALLQDLLANGPLPVTQIYDAALAASISIPTLKRAKSRLGIKSNKHPNQWTWQLPID